VEPPRPVPEPERVLSLVAATEASPEPAKFGSRLSPSAAPSVRRFARELGVDLSAVRGSGPRGRILKDDIQSFVKTSVSASPDAPVLPKALASRRVDFAEFGEIERVARPRLRKVAAENLARNWAEIPHVTNFDEADITGLEAFRKGQTTRRDADVKITLLAFLLKASAVALRRFPQFNSSLDGEELVLKRYVHIGFAVDTPNGLMVPVIREADTKGLRDLATEAAALAAHARDAKLKPSDLRGGCFTVSSLGGVGGTGFTPIINAPDVAILGAARSQMRPVWDGAAFQPRLMLPLMLSWDHRVVDGVAAARFLSCIVEVLTDLRVALL
jgi:pyruvate dehydrogenase E2 component (dihydrolipoamide acetyltransferase)